jgi:regulator of cell morphogenesis and NO signaling
MDTDSPLLPPIPAMSNVQLMRYLVFTHHEFTRNIMDEIAELITQASATVPDLPADFQSFSQLWVKYSKAMRQHLVDEERILFPWIEEASESGKTSEQIAARYSGAVKQMLHEHEHHESDINQIRQMADKLSAEGGHVPVLSLLSYKLRQLAFDLAEHMEIETKLLFPRILNKISQT